MKKLPLISFISFVCLSSLFAQNASYDAQGRLTSDPANHISLIEWNNIGKVSHVVAKDAEIEFSYDSKGIRMRKLVKPKNDNGVMPPSSWKYTYYQYDAAGREVSRYDRTFVKQEPNQFVDEFAVKEVTIDGGRHTLEPGDTEIKTKFTATETNAFENVIYTGTIIPASKSEAHNNRGQKRYELVNHGKSVSSVVSDRKKGGAELFFAQDYYPFGMTLANRSYEKENYTFGFAGKESDPEIEGAHNNYDFGARLFDARLGRWWSIDAKASTYPQISPYAYAINNPIACLDPDGNDVTLVAGVAAGPKSTKSNMNESIMTAKLAMAMIENLSITRKIFGDANNNKKVHAYIAFVEGPMQNHLGLLDGLTYTVHQPGPLTPPDPKYIDSNYNFNIPSIPQLNKINVYDDITRGKEVIIITVTVRTPDGQVKLPANVANTVVHEVDAHINIAKKPETVQLVKDMRGVMNNGQIEHWLYGTDPTKEGSEETLDANNNVIPYGYQKDSHAEMVMYTIFESMRQMMKASTEQKLPLDEAMKVGFQRANEWQAKEAERIRLAKEAKEKTAAAESAPKK